MELVVSLIWLGEAVGLDFFGESGALELNYLCFYFLVDGAFVFWVELGVGGVKHLVGGDGDHLALQAWILNLENVDVVISGIAPKLDNGTTNWSLAMTLKSGAVGINYRLGLIENVFGSVGHLSFLGKLCNCSRRLIGDLVDFLLDLGLEGSEPWNFAKISQRQKSEDC